MHKLGGNRTLAPSGGNALDRAVTHVAGYLLAGLAHLIVRTDVAAHHSNQVTAIRRRAFWSNIFRVPAHSSQRMLPCLPLFAVHTDGLAVAGFGARAFGEFLVCRIAEDAAHSTVARIQRIASAFISQTTQASPTPPCYGRPCLSPSAKEPVPVTAKDY